MMVAKCTRICGAAAAWDAASEAPGGRARGMPRSRLTDPVTTPRHAFGSAAEKGERAAYRGGAQVNSVRVGPGAHHGTWPLVAD